MTDTTKKAIFLYDFTGLMAQPWLDAGYECWLFDGQHEPGVKREGNLVKVGMWFHHDQIHRHASCIVKMVGEGVRIVIGFPECTYLTTTGARWLYHPDDKHLPFKERRPHPMHPDRRAKQRQAVELFKLPKAVADLAGCPFASENPAINVLNTQYARPDYKFNPWEYGGYLPEDDVHPSYPDYINARDAYPKNTGIWCGNGFLMPEKKPVYCDPGYSKQYERLGGKSLKTKNIRSATPRGFAIAVYEANHD